MEKFVRCQITIKSDDFFAINRNFLCCINKQCMTGKVAEVTYMGFDNNYEIVLYFIQPIYFKDIATLGSTITLQEASKILYEGVITYVHL